MWPFKFNTPQSCIERLVRAIASGADEKICVALNRLGRDKEPGVCGTRHGRHNGLNSIMLYPFFKPMESARPLAPPMRMRFHQAVSLGAPSACSGYIMYLFIMLYPAWLMGEFLTVFILYHVLSHQELGAIQNHA